MGLPLLVKKKKVTELEIEIGFNRFYLVAIFATSGVSTGSVMNCNTIGGQKGMCVSLKLPLQQMWDTSCQITDTKCQVAEKISFTKHRKALSAQISIFISTYSLSTEPKGLTELI